MSQQFLFKGLHVHSLHTGTVGWQRLRSGVVMLDQYKWEGARMVFSFPGAVSLCQQHLAHEVPVVPQAFPLPRASLSAGPLGLTGLLLSSQPGHPGFFSGLAGSFLLQLCSGQDNFFTFPGFSGHLCLAPVYILCVTLHRHSFPVSTPGCELFLRRHFWSIKCNNNGKWSLRLFQLIKNISYLFA